ncbi:MAG TPA: hypothetical protein VMH36_23715 [Alphaproteobacteria bacterium]|nr:hypothetical protein [Alphaproteobacteria bacterium]
MRATPATLLLAMAFLLSGCISYSSSHQPVPVGPAAPMVPACVYAGQPYSPGAMVYPPNSAPLQCRGDGSWYPG